MEHAEQGQSQPERQSSWGSVEEEHKAILRAQNDRPITFSIPSAEGIQMYQGIGDRMRRQAQRGLADLTRQIIEEREASQEPQSNP
ncbi:MAG TPA: hypothetical protein VNG32_03190 [Candidatus Dormibacteraeota bacterium]|nr:hypothetical protein [Candidatus Dormibacteraeota bacterium]